MATTVLIISSAALAISIYSAFFKKPHTKIDGKRILTILDSEMNVSTKIVGDKRVLVDEQGEVLDKKRINI
ncbi:hypothetical protein Phi13:2_gp083 [Cellulophaga phage phi13:2]|uniref:Uncharacterized protein n=1 Tax=Cellulophaga phage phi13:2 TaxID=1328030 RepID=S0A5V0_9CAUD|nr:hypothetical protein Phi13:2_gp083 [Cellulophaga phage phi13:2]AGO49693.1 hypothetical protein Phi13:2_gp083 [Cellulophaga phage phi13:2]